MKSVPVEKLSFFFNEMVNLKTVVHDPFANCYAKAQIMVEKIERLDYTAQYAWAFDAPRQALSVKIDGRLHVWHYHVAPVVTVQWPTGMQEPVVIDPTLFDAPVKPAEWGAVFDALPGNVEIVDAHQKPSRAWERNIDLSLEEARERMVEFVYHAAQYETPKKRLNNFSPAS